MPWAGWQLPVLRPSLYSRVLQLFKFDLAVSPARCARRVKPVLQAMQRSDCSAPVTEKEGSQDQQLSLHVWFMVHKWTQGPWTQSQMKIFDQSRLSFILARSKTCCVTNAGMCEQTFDSTATLQPISLKLVCPFSSWPLTALLLTPGSWLPSSDAGDIWRHCGRAVGDCFRQVGGRGS